MLNKKKKKDDTLLIMYRRKAKQPETVVSELDVKTTYMCE